LKWAREALGSGRYLVVEHAKNRQRQRDVTAADMKSIIKKATVCEAHTAGIPRFDGTYVLARNGSEPRRDRHGGRRRDYMDYLGRRLTIVTVS
jgi:hypothetical protein